MRFVNPWWCITSSSMPKPARLVLPLPDRCPECAADTGIRLEQISHGKELISRGRVATAAMNGLSLSNAAVALTVAVLRAPIIERDVKGNL